MQISIIQHNMYQPSIAVLLAALAVGVLAFPGPKPSTAHIERLESWEKSDQNMRELSGKAQGDMVLLPEQEYGSMNNYEWKNNVMPYELSPVFSEEEAKIIHKAVKALRAKSGLNVRPRNDDRDFVYVTAEKTGCWANVGRLGGNQTINLQIDKCLTYQTIINEFLHAAGVYHQHSSTDHDEYDINSRNVKIGTGLTFDIIANLASSSIDSEEASSDDGNSTIVPRYRPWIGNLGIMKKMSDDAIENLLLGVGIVVIVSICIAKLIAICRG